MSYLEHNVKSVPTGPAQNPALKLGRDLTTVVGVRHRIFDALFGGWRLNDPMG